MGASTPATTGVEVPADSASGGDTTAEKWPYYKEFRNNLLLNIQETKQRYYRKLINDSKPHAKWDVVNIIADKRKNSRDIQELVNDGHK